MSMDLKMSRRGAMWYLIFTVLVSFPEVSFASESYVVPVLSQATGRLRRQTSNQGNVSYDCTITACSSQTTERWTTRYPLWSSKYRFEFDLAYADNPEMKNYRVSSSDSNLSLLLKRPGPRGPKPLIPIANLGDKYIFTSCQYQRPMNTEMIIASHVTGEPTEVKVRLKIQGNITHGGKVYKDGESLSIRMGNLETVSIKSESDLTGSTITSNSKVAVFVRIYYGRTELGFEQLIPVSLYGKEFVVATGSNESYQLDVVGEHFDTVITLNNGTKINLANRNIYRQALSANASDHMVSSKPVMVTLCKLDSNQSLIDLVVVPPVTFYTKVPFVTTTSSTECKFMTDKFNPPGVVVQQQIPHQLVWRNITNSTFTVGTFVSYINTQFELNFLGKFGVLCFQDFHIHHSGFGKIMNLKNLRNGIEFIIPTGLRWSIYSERHDLNGTIEIEKSIPSYELDTFSGGFSPPVSGCMIVTDYSSSLSFHGSIGAGKFSILPVSALGYRYVISSCSFKTLMPVLMITTHDEATEVDIILTINGTYIYMGNTYYDGDTISLSLPKCFTVTLHFNIDITGTVIEAKNATIAVFSGLWHHLDSRPVKALGQLLPVSQHGIQHVIDVPPDQGYSFQIVTAHRGTEVNFSNGESLPLGNSRRYNRMWNESEALVLTSTHPVMVTICRGSGFVVNPPVHTYRNFFSVGLNFPASTVLKIFMDGNATNDLQLNSSNNQIDDIEWTDVSGYKVGTVIPTKSPFLSLSSIDKVAVLFFVTFNLHNGGYNFTSRHEKVPPSKNDEDWPIYVIAAGTGLCTTASMVFGGFVYIRRRRRQEQERGNSEKSKDQVDRGDRPPHPQPDQPPPVIRL